MLSVKIVVQFTPRQVDSYVNLWERLTYMSTLLMLLKHEAPGGRLCRFEPSLIGRQRKEYGRLLSVETDVHTWLHDESKEPLQAKAAIRVHLNRYARGQPVDDCDFMKRVEDRRRPSTPFSHGVWAVTPRFNPQYRFFGLFAVMDWFVILNKQSRDVLAQIDSRWHAEMDKSLKLWGELFPGRSPWIPERLHEFISSNAEKCDDRW
jgi:hypothetical protein